MAHCRLDTFPVELVHQLLGYFWSHEILRTFSNVSSYLDAVLLAYPCYRLNFKSIRRADFDLVCRRIFPHQVISLTLSDDKDTPGQVEIFLSRFRVEQFTHLRSLTLIDIGPDWWELIVSKLNELKKLCTFLYIAPTKANDWISNVTDDEITELDVRLSETYAPVLSQLSRLKLNHGDYLTTAHLTHLRHLTLGRCSIDTLKHICQAASQLESLNIELRCFDDKTEFVYPFAHLNRLVLKITGLSISMNGMERLLSNLPRLKHLELDVFSKPDLVDGQRWQTLTSGLIIFNFMFQQIYISKSADLNSFRTRFWVEKKRWFVAYRKYCLFSVPFFANTLTGGNFALPRYSTAPDDTIYYECATHLQLSKPVADSYHRFTHVETLEIGLRILPLTLQKTIDVSRVQHLILTSSTNNLRINSLLNSMPNLYRLFIGRQINNLLRNFRHRPIEKVRILEVGNSFEDEDYNIKELSRIFPCVEQLYVKHMCTRENIIDFINQFKHLSIASFHHIPWSLDYENAQSHRSYVQSTINRIRRVQNFGYRFAELEVHLWI